MLRILITTILLVSSLALLYGEDITFESNKKADGGVESEIIIINKIIKYRNEAREAFLSGQYSQAVDKFNQVLIINPDDSIATRELEIAKTAGKYLDDARISFAEKNYEAVIVACTQLLSLNPDDKKARNLLESTKNILRYFREAENFFAQGQFNLAILSYNEILKIAPGDRDIFDKIKACTIILEGRRYFQQSKYEKAMSSFRQVLSLKPNNASLLRELNISRDTFDSLKEARISFGEHNYREAVVFYQQVLRLNEHDEEAQEKLKLIGNISEYLQKGDALFVKGKYKEAVQNYEYALKLDPLSAIITDKINYAKRAQKFTDEGHDFFKKITDKVVEYDEIIKRIMDEETLEKGRVQEKQITKEFIQFRNDARKQFASGEYDTAMVLYKQALSISPKDERLLEELDRTQKAIELSKKGKSLFAKGQYNEAKEIFRDLLTLTAGTKRAGEINLEPKISERDEAILKVYNPADKQIVYSYYLEVQGEAPGAVEVEINHMKVKPSGGGKFSAQLPLFQLGKNVVTIKVMKADKTFKKTYRVLRLANFTDVERTQVYEVGVIATLGLLTGDSHGLFYPTKPILRKDFRDMLSKLDEQYNLEMAGENITRKDAIKAICKLLKLPNPPVGSATDFKDVSTKDPDSVYIAAAFKAEIINKFSGDKFRPNDYLTRLEAVNFFLSTPLVRDRVKVLINWEEGY